MRIASHAKSKLGGPPIAVERTAANVWEQVFAALFGGLLGLSLLKFGNPIIMEKYMEWPTNLFEWVLNSWPIVIGYWILAIVTALGLFVAQWKITTPKWLVAMPLVWLVWEMISASHSLWPEISRPTVVHFATCAVCFYLGLFSLGRIKILLPFWIGLMVGLFFVFASGFQQHFGGLEETRRYWFLYVYPTMKEIPPSLLKKMSSTRIFSTLFYPNTLAGVILLLLPGMLAVLWSLHERFTVGARRFLMGAMAVGALACLFWSGSKGGWLLLLVMGIVATLFMAIPRRFKLMLIYSVLIVGLAGFFVKYAGFFKKGATSVVARFDYWQAALKTAEAKPVFGNGPGTFGKAYERIKKPESEMALMTHNDYLEQACDSGLPGFLAYSTFVVGTLIYVFRRGIGLPRFSRSAPSPQPSPPMGAREVDTPTRAKPADNLPALAQDWAKLSIWLGLLGWALQSFVEFGLYIPAIAWPAFAFMGWLLARCRNEMDSPKGTS